MRFVDDLNRTSKDAFTNAAISACFGAITYINLIVQSPAVAGKLPIIPWITVALFALGALYMFSRGRHLRRIERNRERASGAS